MNKDAKIKMIVTAVLLSVVMFMVIYSMLVFGGESESKGQERASFAAPKLERKQYDYNRRIDMVNAKIFIPENQEKKKLDFKTDTENDLQNPFLTELGHKPAVEPTSKTPVKIKTTHYQAEPVKIPKAEPGLQEPVQQEPLRRRKQRHLSSTDANTSISSLRASSSIPCKIYGDHRITNNSKIRARITKDVVVNDVPIKRNTIITGIAQLTSTKVKIRFETIQYNNRTIPANMKAYGRDGLEGIYIEGGIQNDVKKDVYDELIDAGITGTVDHIPLVGSIVKSTTKKQNKTVYVEIPNDYTIYLKQ